MRIQLKKMAKKKSLDYHGVVAEMLQNARDGFLELIANIFGDILCRAAPPPESWKQARLKVLLKKGDAKLPDNYRPITILPILYKLFSHIVCKRITPILEESQSRDQAGFRSGFACIDYLFTMVLLTERAAEYHTPVWLCAVDFRKAFDSAMNRCWRR